jgi:hypothetical protein
MNDNNIYIPSFKLEKEVKNNFISTITKQAILETKECKEIMLELKNDIDTFINTHYLIQPPVGELSDILSSIESQSSAAEQFRLQVIIINDQILNVANESLNDIHKNGYKRIVNSCDISINTIEYVINSLTKQLNEKHDEIHKMHERYELLEKMVTLHYKVLKDSYKEISKKINLKTDKKIENWMDIEMESNKWMHKRMKKIFNYYSEYEFKYDNINSIETTIKDSINDKDNIIEKENIINEIDIQMNIMNKSIELSKNKTINNTKSKLIRKSCHDAVNNKLEKYCNKILDKKNEKLNQEKELLTSFSDRKINEEMYKLKLDFIKENEKKYDLDIFNFEENYYKIIDDIFKNIESNNCFNTMLMLNEKKLSSLSKQSSLNNKIHIESLSKLNIPLGTRIRELGLISGLSYEDIESILLELLPNEVQNVSMNHTGGGLII